MDDKEKYEVHEELVEELVEEEVLEEIHEEPVVNKHAGRRVMEKGRWRWVN